MVDRYDTGLLGDGGGGDVQWWQDYIRVELDRAHEFYTDQLHTAINAHDDLVAALEEIAKGYNAEGGGIALASIAQDALAKVKQCSN